METIKAVTMIFVSLSGGMFFGALTTFWRMHSRITALEKELDFKNKLLQKDEHKIFSELDMIAFAKFNTKHYDGIKNVYGKLDLYNRTREKQ